jgi:hypothetical protein
MEKEQDFIPFEGDRFLEDEMLRKSQEFYNWADKRRSVRDFSSKQVPVEIMENLIMTASTAPFGAHKQPMDLLFNIKQRFEIRLKKTG